MAASDLTQEATRALLEFCLPLPLQDLCLLEIINDLDSYPVDLLSRLPRWLRYRLVNNLPVLDLCRHERSPIAQGFDLDELWNSRWENPRIPHPLYQPPLSSSIRSDFHYRIKDAGFRQDFEPELIAAFQHLSNKGAKVDAKQKYLLQVVSDVLDSREFETDDRALTIVAADWLISMKGDRLLQDLTEAKHNPHQARSRITYVTTSSRSRQRIGVNDPQSIIAADSDAYKQIWGSQTTALARYEQDDIRLTPHRLLPIRQRGDPLELLSLLINDCGLQPLSVAHLGLTRMTNSQEWGQCVEEGEKFNKILQHILRQVVILGLQCDYVSAPDSVLQTLMAAVFGADDREKCQLRYIFSQHVTREFMISLSPHFYVLPDAKGPPGKTHHYQGLSVIELGVSSLEPSLYISALLEQQPQLKAVQLGFNCGGDGVEACSDAVQLFSTLSSLFSRPQFRFLKLELKAECSIASPLLLEVLSGFMRAPCATTKQLTMTSESSDPAGLLPQKEVELAKVDVSGAGASAVPECGIEYKTLSLSANLQGVVGNLLQLSTIRVKNIDFYVSDDAYTYLHQGALHPDLQVSSLDMRFELCPYDQILTTIESDLVTFFKKPLLQEISLHGYWGMFEEIKTAVVSALSQRAKTGVGLRKLILFMPPHMHAQTTISRFGNEQLYELWKAVLMLPELNQMEVVMGGGICDLTLQNEESVYEIWKELGSSRAQFKLLKMIRYTVVVERNEDHKLFSEMAQTLLFTNKPHRE